MIKRQDLKNDKVKVTFVLPHEDELSPVSVVGDFNAWDPQSNKLVKRNNGTRSTSVTLDAGQKVRFRYFSDDGQWFNDDAADAYETGEHGAENCVIFT